MAENPFNEVVIYPASETVGQCENCGAELVTVAIEKLAWFGCFSDAAILAALDDGMEF